MSEATDRWINEGGCPATEVTLEREYRQTHRCDTGHPQQGNAGIRVILVDDHALVRDAIRTLLEERGVKVVAEAANGREALDALSVGADLVLMDLSMPVMNGIEATAAIRERDPSVEVLAFTIDDSPEIVDAMLAAGASRHFAKNDYLALFRYLAARADAAPSSDAGARKFA